MSEKLLISKDPITDEKIIELYKQGISQKDIATKYSVSLGRTQRVLRSAGFPTHSYRAIDNDMKSYVIILINEGCSYFKIESICDIAFHAVRTIVENNNLLGVSNKARYRKSKENIEYLPLPEYEPFLTDYRNGHSFVFLCNEYSLNADQVIYVFNLISDEDIEEHKKSLTKRIISLNKKGFLSASSIAKQLDISPSIVRKTIGKT